jgi:2-C-methyl-D-erythritol 4-phosphate cytidylyltransferase/2-C-methyl-D-erythritol 2,4-cyclodiphosphate synthase
MAGSAEREALRRVQTPRRSGTTPFCPRIALDGDADGGDDAQVRARGRLAVALVEGDERLRKLTFAEDFMDACLPRTGTGFDVHRLAEARSCGCAASGRHDAASPAQRRRRRAPRGGRRGARRRGAGDIGQHFPPSDPQWRGAPSSRFVEHAVGWPRARLRSATST